LDSGRIIVFPAATPFRRRIEKSCCQMMCEDLLNFYETLIEADLSDSEMQRAVCEKELEVVEWISQTGELAHLPRMLKRSKVEVRCYGMDLEVPIKVETFEDGG